MPQTDDLDDAFFSLEKRKTSTEAIRKFRSAKYDWCCVLRHRILIIPGSLKINPRKTSLDNAAAQPAVLIQQAPGDIDRARKVGHYHIPTTSPGTIFKDGTGFLGYFLNASDRFS